MGKINWKPGNMVYPLPAALISCGSEPETYNLITVSWIGTLCTDPPMCYISVRPGRHSSEILKQQGEFVINLTTKDMARATDWCGVRSGRDYNKFRESGLTPLPATVVNCPIVAESPVSIECKVREVRPLGTHDLFIADVVNVIADDRFIDPESGAMDLETAGLIAYSHGNYYELGKKIGKFGWSVMKEKTRRRQGRE
ncbi:MAG: flavin reductase family protein [Marinilabiliales bacterium]|nr:flavin reductase family protein [Marinilabiliales bacterium]